MAGERQPKTIQEYISQNSFEFRWIKPSSNSLSRRGENSLKVQSEGLAGSQGSWNRGLEPNRMLSSTHVHFSWCVGLIFSHSSLDLFKQWGIVGLITREELTLTLYLHFQVLKHQGRRVTGLFRVRCGKLRKEPDVATYGRHHQCPPRSLKPFTFQLPASASMCPRASFPSTT